MYIENKGKPNETTTRHTPPFPTLVGGGPRLSDATVTPIHATARSLKLWLLDAEGRELTRLDLAK